MRNTIKTAILRNNFVQHTLYEVIRILFLLQIIVQQPLKQPGIPAGIPVKAAIFFIGGEIRHLTEQVAQPFLIQFTMPTGFRETMPITRTHWQRIIIREAPVEKQLLTYGNHLMTGIIILTHQETPILRQLMIINILQLSQRVTRVILSNSQTVILL